MISNISDKIVFNALKNIKYGRIYLTNFNGEKYTFGKENEILKVKIKIKKPGFTLDVVNKGSIGMAESYMRGEFETDNLTNLIEITAKNIKKVHKFSGVLDLPLINFFKYLFTIFSLLASFNISLINKLSVSIFSKDIIFLTSLLINFLILLNWSWFETNINEGLQSFKIYL